MSPETINYFEVAERQLAQAERALDAELHEFAARESYLAALMPALEARGHRLAYLHHNPRAEAGPTRLVEARRTSVSVADEGLDRAIQQVRTWQPDVCFSHNMRALEVDELEHLVLGLRGRSHELPPGVGNATAIVRPPPDALRS